MSLDDTNPQYDEFAPDWKQMRDTNAGERVVKEAKTTYLPYTSGMIEDGIANSQELGWKAYAAYNMRAVYPEIVSQSIETLLGLLHHKPAKIELPKKLEYLRENATESGETLLQLLRRTNAAQLLTGRIGYLLDMPTDPVDKAEPLYIATYEGENILNWDAGMVKNKQVLNFVILDETQQEVDGSYSWVEVKIRRVLVMDDNGKYSFQVVTDSDTVNDEAFEQPTLQGVALDEIPFVFINSKFSNIFIFIIVLF